MIHLTQPFLLVQQINIYFILDLLNTFYIQHIF